MAPPESEDLGAGALLGREEGDDVAEDGVGELADAIGASAFFSPLMNFLRNRYGMGLIRRHRRWR